MAGHSKWANIRHRKERMDSKRSKLFAQFIKEVTIAAKIGGPHPESNSRLRLAVEKAHAGNVPNDNVERAIKRGSGQLESVDYTEVRYEGYGPGGVAFIVDCLTDNKNRALPEIRHAFAKHGGQLGDNGSVSYLFSRCGQLFFPDGVDENLLTETAIEYGASDLNSDEENNWEVICDADDFLTLLDALKNAGLSPAESDIVMRPSSEVLLTGDNLKKNRQLINRLEDLDDTQHIYTNAIWNDENNEDDLS